MTLSDLRKAAVKRHLRIRFRLANGMECVVDEHGIARVPELAAPPDFRLERELEQARNFDIEPADSRDGKPRRRTLTREETAELTAAAPASPEDHDE